MNYRYIFTTCNNCGKITALVDLEEDKQAGWSWFDDDKKVPSYNFLQHPCCSGNTYVNPCVSLHFTNDETVLIQEESE